LFPHNCLGIKVGVLRDSHYLFSTPYRKFKCFFGGKKKKNCASRFEAKKAAMGLSVASRLVARLASWRHNRTGTDYSSTVLFWLFREINGNKVATMLVFKSADN
jgi:hypothetical protein